ncbi:MAG: hypothetical protein DHS20C18_29760 [Saprospiraceae bacterium]|nr:MAG: hypothetical protein DHS20C18_29760 [Saprospiraceae bacterium]
MFQLRFSYLSLAGLAIFLLGFATSIQGQNQGNHKYWHGIERSIRYQPEEEAIVIRNGERRFNRALYGANTGFRVETGDLPEFALYMPRMGGTVRLGLMTASASKWLIDADSILARYHPGTMSYEIKDALLGSGTLSIEVLAMHQAEGIIFRCKFDQAIPGVTLFWMYGGVSDERFNREGDIGADPESVFYLTAENCAGNIYELEDHTFRLKYNSQDKNYQGGAKQIKGIIPPGRHMKQVDASVQNSPALCFASSRSKTPAIAGKLKAARDWQYFLIHNANDDSSFIYSELEETFKQADQQRRDIANRVKLVTPDIYINPLGGALSIAADAIWETPAYHHGAIAWRQQLNGWRGAYVADPMGWHDRAQMHIRAYAKSQLSQPESGPNTPDISRNFARQKEEIGTAIFTKGYISRYPDGERLRAHHYDMNQVFIDQVLRHFNWTGDLDFVREMWPVLQRHLAWEKRCFDTDGDALYDAYCSFWASDAVQYSGGGVTHASAYHHYANTRMAQLAQLIGKNPEPYLLEAAKIKLALNRELWLPDKGCFAEFKDLLGLQQLHTSPGLWTIYHTIDSEVSDPFQTFQLLQYIDHEIPHIPISAKGLPRDDYYTLSTTNWLPYTWSVNNVALAEVMHTALAYWQGGRKETAFHLWKSALMESMYLGASPGSIQQLSFYDAIRGELYRDFADPVGMTARSLVEGLFGITPDALNKVLTIRPGLPLDWEYATLEVPDISFHFEHKGQIDRYSIKPDFSKRMDLNLLIPARSASVQSVKVNGNIVKWTNVEGAIGYPMIAITTTAKEQYDIEIIWNGDAVETLEIPPSTIINGQLAINCGHAEITTIHDPQHVFKTHKIESGKLAASVGTSTGWKTVFAKMQQGALSWWEPMCFVVNNPIEIEPLQQQASQSLNFRIRNNTDFPVQGTLFLGKGNREALQDVSIAAYETSEEIRLISPNLVSGSNLVRFKWDNHNWTEKKVVNWEIKNQPSKKWKNIDLTAFFNEKVNEIFKQKYLSPRPTGPTVQLPIQGIGNWCYPLVEVEINDAGLRELAGQDERFKLSQNIPFRTPGPGEQENIVFTSKWHNFPDQVTIPLTGKANHLYLLMAGSTNPMQSRIDNGLVEISYTDGSTTVLPLRNPETWWPIEQDYYLDGFAFYSDLPVPPRVHLKTGLVTRDFRDYTSIKGFSDTGIDGGAATVLDLPLNPDKTLKTLRVETLANDVVIGLMGITLMMIN